MTLPPGERRPQYLRAQRRAEAAAEWRAHQAALTAEAESRHAEAMDHRTRLILPRSAMNAAMVKKAMRFGANEGLAG